MEFRQLEYFEAVAKSGSVSRAAKELGMTQPPLSAAISRLEQELGVQLLIRSPQGVRATPAGRYLLAQGGRMLATRQRVERMLQLMGKGLVGELRVGAEPMVIHEIIADVLATFSTLAPDVRIALSDSSPRAILEGVSTHQFDVGCIPFDPESLCTSIVERFDLVPIKRIDLMLAVPASRGEESHPDGQGWGRWIVPHRIPGMPGMPDAVEAQLAGPDSYDAIFVSNPQTAIPLVSAGLGVAPSTRRICESDGRVAMIEPPRWLKPMQATMVLRKGAERTPVIARWLDLAAAAGKSTARATGRFAR